MSQLSRWNLNKIIVVFLAGAFLLLDFEIRYEHVDVVRHHWVAWIPIAYSPAMFVLCLLCPLFWRQGGRLILLWTFSLGIIVGGLGFWFHNQGHWGQHFGTMVAAWNTGEHHHGHPPTLAPLSFCGLGLLGILATAGAFQPRRNPV